MDLNNICRTCLRVPKRPINLFHSTNQSLLHKILVISSVKIEKYKDLSLYICEECYKDINRLFNFRKLIRNTNNDLKSRLAALRKTNYSSTRQNNENVSISFLPINIKNEQPKKKSYTRKILSGSKDSLTLQSDERMALTLRKIYQCTDCNQIFKSRTKLYGHRLVKHIPKSICSICGLKLRADNLSKHIRAHSEPPSSCNICGKTFKNSDSLRTHRFMHLEQCYTCDICGKSLKMKSEFTRHLKRHADPDFRKQSCQICGKKFSHLKAHMRSHTGERPFVCEFCRKGFSSTNALKVHRRRHTNEKPYTCEYCNESFPQAVSLKSHLKRRHRIS